MYNIEYQLKKEGITVDFLFNIDNLDELCIALTDEKIQQIKLKYAIKDYKKLNHYKHNIMLILFILNSY